MQTKLEKLPNSRVKLTITVPKAKMADFFDEAYKKLASTVTIKGFRPGSAPKAMTLEAIGQGRYEREALDLALPLSYSDAVKETKINPIQPPAISMKETGEGSDFIYEAEVDVMPEIKLGDYKKIRVNFKQEKHDASAEEVEKIIEKLRYRDAKFSEADRAAKNGDKVEVSFDGSIDRVKQENMSSPNYPLIIGSNTLIPGFEDKLIDMKKGEEKEFDLDVPHNQDPKKKKKAVFKVKLHKVESVDLPKADNEFAKKFGHDSLDNLNKAIRESVIVEKDTVQKRKLEEEIFNKLASITDVEIPASLIEQEIDRRIYQIQAQTGPGLEKMLEKMKKTTKDLRSDLKSEAIKTIKIGLALGEVAKSENLTESSQKDNAKKQQEITTKTINKLVELATK